MKRIADLANRIAQQAQRPIVLPAISAPGAAGGAAESTITQGNAESYRPAARDVAIRAEVERQTVIERGGSDTEAKKAASAVESDYVKRFEETIKKLPRQDGVGPGEQDRIAERMGAELKQAINLFGTELKSILAGERGLRTQARDLDLQEAPLTKPLTVDAAAYERLAQSIYNERAQSVNAAPVAVSATTTAAVRPGATPPQATPAPSVKPSPAAVKDNAVAQQNEDAAARKRREASANRLKEAEAELQASRVYSRGYGGQRTIYNEAGHVGGCSASRADPKASVCSSLRSPQWA
jgi:hypothetical protein